MFTLDREIFAVKMFLWLPQNTKIFLAKYIQQEHIFKLRRTVIIKNILQAFQAMKLFYEKFFYVKYLMRKFPYLWYVVASTWDSI